ITISAVCQDGCDDQSGTRRGPDGVRRQARQGRKTRRGPGPRKPRSARSNTVAAFKTPSLAQLTDQQARFAPPQKRQEQLERARKLLADVEPGKAYPYQFIVFRVTEYRPDSYPDVLVPGEDLRHDLALMIEALGGAAPAEAQPKELVTLDDLAKRLNVSTKTVRRWRKFGLVGRRVIRDGRRQLCFDPTVIDQFLAENRERA